MQVFYEYGTKLLELVGELGRWLTTPLIDLANFNYDAFQSEAVAKAFRLAVSNLGLADWTILHMIIGSGLLFLLGFKLVKFFVSLITG